MFNENNFDKKYLPDPRWFIPAVIIFALFIVGVITSFAEDGPKVKVEECQDPETLSPEMKKAYYELKEILKDMPGAKVEIKCN